MSTDPKDESAESHEASQALQEQHRQLRQPKSAIVPATRRLLGLQSSLMLVGAASLLAPGAAARLPVLRRDALDVDLDPPRFDVRREVERARLSVASEEAIAKAAAKRRRKAERKERQQQSL